MEEKILIKSESYKIKRSIIIFIVAFGIIGFLANIIAYAVYTNNHPWHFYNNFFDFYTHNMFYFYFDLECVPGLTLLGFVVVTLAGLLLNWWLKSYELTVTDKRVYGKVAFGKRVDLPYDSISAISTFGLLKGISVATSSGRIKFRLVKNANQVYDVLNHLLLERQESKKSAPVKEVVAAPSNAAELKQYKELLDEGVISQEEFDAKKKLLLGL